METVPNSSTNLMTLNMMGSPRVQDSVTRRDSIHSSYHSLLNKEIRIGVEHEQSALPPTYSNA